MAAGSVFDRFCHWCGERVMIAPSGQALLKTMPELKIMCAVCFASMDADAEEILLPASIEELRREIATARPNTWRQRN
jgi:hypothetical protein